MLKFRTKRNFPGRALVQTIAVVIVNITFTFQTKVWGFHGNCFYPSWFASCFLYRSQWSRTQLCHKVQVSLSNGSSGTNTRKKNIAGNVLSHPTTTFPHLWALLLCWAGAQGIPEWVVISKSNDRLPPTMTSLYQIVRIRRELELWLLIY